MPGVDTASHYFRLLCCSKRNKHLYKFKMPIRHLKQVFVTLLNAIMLHNYNMASAEKGKHANYSDCSDSCI